VGATALDEFMIVQAAGVWRSDKFKCHGDTGYNCMRRHGLHGSLMVSLLACPCELDEVYG